MSEMLQTEFSFELPMGYIDHSGTRHRSGTMRLATAGDEILPLRDPRTKGNPAFVSIIILARVVTNLGSLDMINTQVIENLFSSDFAYLQDMYNRINRQEANTLPTNCPKCGEHFAVDATPVGED